jgi:hypothetical protein
MLPAVPSRFTIWVPSASLSGWASVAIPKATDNPGARKDPAPLDIYLLYLDATIGQSERCAANFERLARAEPTHRRSKHSSDTIPAMLAASSDLVEHARILVKNARDACDLLRQLRAECEMLRQSGALEKPVEGTSELDNAHTIRLVSK